MQIPLLHQQILLQTERLRDLHRSIMIHPSPFPSSEMDSLLLEIRKLYSLALQLGNENSVQLLEEIHLASVEIREPVQNIATPEISFMPVTEKKSEIVTPAPVIEPVLSTPAEINTNKKIPDTVPHMVYHEAQTLAGRFADHQTVGERIGVNGNKKTVFENLRVPVKDLKAAIGLNEKFQFINQLFNGDSNKYNTIVDAINASQSADTALNYIRDISEKNNWELHAASAKNFIDLIERRFSA